MLLVVLLRLPSLLSLSPSPSPLKSTFLSLTLYLHNPNPNLTPTYSQPSPPTSFPPVPIVAVTGAAGFVGSNVVKQLLDSGRYRVRGTVRSLSSAGKTDFLRQMDAGGRLELFEADLMAEGAFAAAFRGAAYVVHTAAKVALTAPDPQKEIIDCNVNGMLNVMRACAAAASAGSLKKAVVTSSIAAVHDMSLPADHVYTEADYNTTATAGTDPYPASKYASEKAAQAYVDDLEGAERFELAFINPGTKGRGGHRCVRRACR